MNLRRSNDSAFGPCVRIRGTRSIAVNCSRHLTVELIALELRGWNVIVVQEVELLNREAFHLWNNEEDPGHGDEGKCSPDESL